MTNPSTNERERAHWRKWQQRADEVWGWNTAAGRLRADRRAGLFLTLGQMGPSSRVLEIGCGTGEFTARIAPCVNQLLATDLSAELIVRARDRVHRICPKANVAFEVQDATALQIETGRFDAAFGCSVLHHLDAAAALREVFRVLKPGGRCAFSEPNMLNPQIALQKNVGFFKRRAGDSPDETAFFRTTIFRRLQEAGFEDVHVRNFDFLHPRTPAAWIAPVARLGGFFEKCPVIREISGSLILDARKPG